MKTRMAVPGHRLQAISWQVPVESRAAASGIPTCLGLLLLLILAGPVPAAQFKVPDEFLTIQEAVDAAMAPANPDVDNFLDLGSAVFLIHEPIRIGPGFSQNRKLTLRPDPANPALRRVTVASDVSNQHLLELDHAGYVTIEDLDLIRHITNNQDLIWVDWCSQVTFHRCRMGSDWPVAGAADWSVMVLNYPQQVIVRNCTFFARATGTFDRNLYACLAADPSNRLLVYNTDFADHGLTGVEVASGGNGSLVLFRNNVVANHAPLDPEPTALVSALADSTIVVASHNATFASPGNVEDQMGPLPLLGAEALRFNPDEAVDGFEETVWCIDPPWDPNTWFYALRGAGLLHSVAADAGSLDIESDDPYAPGFVVPLGAGGAPPGTGCDQPPLAGVDPEITEPVQNAHYLFGQQVSFRARDRAGVCTAGAYDLCWYFRQLTRDAQLGDVWGDWLQYQFTPGRLLGCDGAIPLPGDYEVKVQICGVMSEPVAFQVTYRDPPLTGHNHPYYTNPDPESYHPVCHIDWDDPENDNHLTTEHFNVFWNPNQFASDDRCQPTTGLQIATQPSAARLGLLECAWATLDHWMTSPLDRPPCSATRRGSRR